MPLKLSFIRCVIDIKSISSRWGTRTTIWTWCWKSPTKPRVDDMIGWVPFLHHFIFGSWFIGLVFYISPCLWSLRALAVTLTRLCVTTFLKWPVYDQIIKRSHWLLSADMRTSLEFSLSDSFKKREPLLQTTWLRYIRLPVWFLLHSTAGPRVNLSVLEHLSYCAWLAVKRTVCATVN